MIERFRSSTSIRQANANGNARDRTGSARHCASHSGPSRDAHRVRRVDHRHRRPFSGQAAQLSERCRRRLRRADWFTDPPSGLGSFYEGTIAEPELNANIYRVDPLTGEAAIAADDVLGPNGLCFSPDEKRLYVVESRAVPNRKVRVFDVVDGRYLRASRVLIDAGLRNAGWFSLRHGRQYLGRLGMGTADLDGVMIFDPEGQLIGRIALPERCANLCFGGRQRNCLFMACGHGLYALYVNAQGAV